MGIGVLVVVAFGQRPQRPTEPLAAGVGTARLTVTVAAPISDRLGDAGQLFIAGVDGATLTGCHLVGWIKAARGQMTEAPRPTGFGCPALSRRVFRSHDITIVLDQPEVVR